MHIVSSKSGKELVNRGFTLVELLTAIALLGFLVFWFGKALNDAYQSYISQLSIKQGQVDLQLLEIIRQNASPSLLPYEGSRSAVLAQFPDMGAITSLLETEGSYRPVKLGDSYFRIHRDYVQVDMDHLARVTSSKEKYPGARLVADTSVTPNVTRIDIGVSQRDSLVQLYLGKPLRDREVASN